MDSGAPANDALLAQLVRGTLGRRRRGTSGINVSSCSFVVTLHGTVGSVGEREQVENIARMVPGVEGVANRLKVA
jgi:osmotically-inducible protein OsmY